MFRDFIQSTGGGLVANGEVAGALQGCHFDPGLMRPWLDKRGRKCVTINTGEYEVDSNGEPIFKQETRLVSDLIANGIQSPVFNATSLRKDEWLMLDRQVMKVARQRLRAWTDLESESSFGGFNGMSKMILEHETMSDPGEAMVDMDGLTEGRTDAPKYQLEGLPLPITHSDFWFSARRLAVSRNTGTPLDSTMAEAATRRVTETIEKTLIGTQAGMTYGTAADYNNAPTVYGYMTHPDRITSVSLTTPTGSNGTATVDNVLAMIEAAADANYFGPFMLYHSTDWDKYLDDDYRDNDDRTLRDRIREIETIRDVRRLDFLTSATNPYTFILVQMTSDVARAVNGMNLTTVQWESQGGARVNFKVMAIMVPQIRSDFNGQTGIVHAVAS